MAVSFSCKCGERKLPVDQRAWFVLQRNCNHSAFNGYRQTYSDYSTVHCEVCRAVGRTKAAYVVALDDADDSMMHRSVYSYPWAKFDPAIFDAEMAEFLSDLLARGKGLHGRTTAGALWFHELTIKTRFSRPPCNVQHVEMQQSTAWIRENPEFFNHHVREFVNRAHSMGWHVRTKSKAGAIRFIAASDPATFTYIPGNYDENK